jgi:hypothetical protein
VAAPEAAAPVTAAPPPEAPRVHELRVTLTPAELGEVTLVVRHEADDRVQATIVAASAPAQQALQQIEPQVRAALAQQGLQMSGLDVSTGGQGTSGQSGWQPPQFQPSPAALPQPRYAAPARTPVPTREASRAGVDLYA